MVRAFIFDFDGLLVDSEQVFDWVVKRYFKEVTGSDIPEDQFLQLRRNMFGRKKEESAQLLYEAMGSPANIKPGDYLVWRKPILEEYFPKVELLLGTADLIRYAQQHGIPMTIATSSSREDLELKTRRHSDPAHRELFSAFYWDLIVTGDQVVKGKPDPALFLEAAARLGFEPADCLVFEDAENGVDAAKNGGFPVIAVPNPMADKKLFQQADEVLSSLEEFNPERWGLPPR